ncbi:Glucosamine-phosphate N-acetyltransferase-like protein [Binucleata daphniae]
MDQNFVIRDLEASDYENGFIDLLNELTETGNITKEMFLERFNMIKQNKDYTIRVIIDKNTKKVVGAGTLFLERKFIHACATKGHIEDIVIDKTYRGKHFGQVIVTDLVDLSKQKGCYKTVLCCRDEITGFYEKCDFTTKEREMVIYHKK